MLLAEHEGAVEADLQRVYGVDYRDRWRGDLSLRRTYNLLKHLPPADSATMRALSGDRMHWSLEAHLLDSLRMTVEATGGAKRPPKPHPMRPLAAQGSRPADTPERRRKLAAARARARERRRRIEAGEIT